MMRNALSVFIDKVYREPYSLVSNNCIHKSLKIKAKAEELGKGTGQGFSIIRGISWRLEANL